MGDSPYASILDQARRDLASAKAAQLQAEARVASLQRAVLALTSLVECPAIDPAAGMTEGIKGVLQLVSPAGLYPTTLRIKLEEAGFDFSKSKNPLAAIHAVLKRLIVQSLVKPAEKEGKTAYFWHVTRGVEYERYAQTFIPDKYKAENLEKVTTITMRSPFVETMRAPFIDGMDETPVKTKKTKTGRKRPKGGK